jgi:excisionase family DNA binding protein
MSKIHYEDDELLRPEQVCHLLKICTRTLFDWEKKGKIQCARTKGGHRRIPYSSVKPLLSNTTTEIPRRKVCYARVSSSGQKQDLERQVEFFRDRYPDHEIVTDIGSGLNFKRKGFKALLEASNGGHIQEIVVTHRDRLCRFGFELVEWIIQSRSNGRILVLDKKETSPQEELVGDLISIITVFSSRLYGLRSGGIKKKIVQVTGSKIQDSENKIISDTTGKR